jgi:hypothetical protein
MGLPTKIGRNATIIDVQTNFFVTDSDTYGGNSGSLVLNAEKLKNGELLAEGILVRGATDFARRSPCLASNRCEVVSLGDRLCGGESSTPTAMIEDALGK